MVPGSTVETTSTRRGSPIGLDDAGEVADARDQGAVVEVARLGRDPRDPLEAGLVRRLDGDEDDLRPLDHLLHRGHLDARPGEQRLGAGLTEREPARPHHLARPLGGVVRDDAVPLGLDRERYRQPQLAQPSEPDLHPRRLRSLPSEGRRKGRNFRPCQARRRVGLVVLLSRSPRRASRRTASATSPPSLVSAPSMMHDPAVGGASCHFTCPVAPSIAVISGPNETTVPSLAIVALPAARPAPEHRPVAPDRDEPRDAVPRVRAADDGAVRGDGGDLEDAAREGRGRRRPARGIDHDEGRRSLHVQQGDDGPVRAHHRPADELAVEVRGPARGARRGIERDHASRRRPSSRSRPPR